MAEWEKTTGGKILAIPNTAIVYERPDVRADDLSAATR